MGEIRSTCRFEVEIGLHLNESEARALKAITEYGAKEFLNAFYEKLGRHYLEPHEDGLKSLFETIKRELPTHLRTADDVRSVWTGNKVAVKPTTEQGQ
jgi:hypothetical protein